ncbi:MAG TPA: beta-galactosidase trimerization domain-containing protein [Phycisphaerae bacterium]|nr:beta-galactosidase trimerization domain-containing protein [Phycisphaerae bacterium]HPS53270.1 beta-galactosidase trimerization domain-containing protein [Phycisphaerae bacterium]
MYKLRFRQVHLDFHTSPDIPDVGSKFDKKQFQEALKIGHINSITCFSKCHHGWSYHDTKVGRRHPNMQGELFRRQYEACKEIDVNIPIYLSAGVDNVITMTHPEWREINTDARFAGWFTSPLMPGFHKMCFNTPYLEYLCEQIREAVTMFPEVDGVFLDIISQGQCCCNWCMAKYRELGLDPTKEENRKIVAEIGLERYYEMTTAAAKCNNPDMPVFHNSGHIRRGRRDLFKWFSHLELESLPTGGWGYDHFPLSAKYCKNLGNLDFLGMTGKFHTTWGEFGGYKHPNALRYECAAMLAFGSKCSVGDQLPPLGQADKSTYELIGHAYSEVEQKEPWCDDVTNIADVGLLSSEACAGVVLDRCHPSQADTGANRILLEGHFLYDILDVDMDFNKYKMLILPDDISIKSAVKTKLDAYLKNGGKLLMTGKSGLDDDGYAMFDIGATVDGLSEYQPDYILPIKKLRASFVDSPLVMYVQSRRLKVTAGESLGDVYDPYFNRTWEHFCGHQHAPYQPHASGYDCGVVNGNIMYLPHPVFTLYCGMGAVAYKEFLCNCIRRLLGSDESICVNLPSTARVSLMRQCGQNRYVLHLLYANTVNRGGEMPLAGGTTTADTTKSVEVIEDLTPLYNTTVLLKIPEHIKTVTLEPQGKELPFKKDGRTVSFTLDEFTCHQMVVLHY